MVPLKQPELWIGLVEVRPVDREAYGAAGAFTNIVTWARGDDEFRRKAETIAATLDLYVAETEDAEPLSYRIAKHSVSDEIEIWSRRQNSILRQSCTGLSIDIPPTINASMIKK